MSDFAKDIANYLHKKFCCFNHADYCFWYYELTEEDPWSGNSHKEWLKNAKNVLSTIEELRKEKSI